MGSLRDLTVYKKAFGLAMEIFHICKSFPVEERFSLPDQVRRSSRSVCTNLGEGYRKRRYPAHFIAKISDTDSENNETQIWLEFALACGYVDGTAFEHLNSESEQVGRLLQHMLDSPGNYGAR